MDQSFVCGGMDIPFSETIPLPENIINSDIPAKQDQVVISETVPVGRELTGMPILRRSERVSRRPKWRDEFVSK